ncbi:MAG: UTRA domain-containing protein, partial [Paracoccaceae bacterium]
GWQAFRARGDHHPLPPGHDAAAGRLVMPQGWEEIRAEVLTRIRSRRWPPGEIIPTEEALAVEFSCARATVNRALRELAQAGVLERKRKAGTRVAILPVRKATLDIPVIRQEVAARGHTYTFRLLAQTEGTPPPSVAARLGLTTGHCMLHLQTLHLADNRAYVFEDRWLNPTALPQPLPDFAAISANEFLVAHVAFASGDIAFSAEPASAPEAAALLVPPATALFITERCTWSPEAPITWVRLAHAPGYRLQTLL